MPAEVLTFAEIIDRDMQEVEDMPDGTAVADLEQTKVAGEQGPEPEDKVETLVPTSESEEGAASTEKETKPPETLPKTFSEEEVRVEAQKLAQSLKDKELQPLRTQLTAAQTKLKELTRQIERAKYGQAISQENGDLPEVGTLLEEKFKVEDAREEVEEKQRQYDEALEYGRGLWNNILDFNIALEFGLPERETIRKKLDPLIKAISEGTTEKEKRRIAELYVLKNSRAVDKQPVRKRLDPNIPSGGGSVDLSTLSVDEKLTSGLAEERTKHKIR